MHHTKISTASFDTYMASLPTSDAVGFEEIRDDTLCKARPPLGMTLDADVQGHLPSSGHSSFGKLCKRGGVSSWHACKCAAHLHTGTRPFESTSRRDMPYECYTNFTITTVAIITAATKHAGDGCSSMALHAITCSAKVSLQGVIPTHSLSPQCSSKRMACCAP